jgi:uncharacterized surface protein with fasciclin (FAS1) repeats
MNISRLGLAAGLAAATMLAGCNRGEEGNNAQTGGNDAAAVQPGEQTVAAALAGDGDLARLGEIVRNAGLDTLLGGTGPYTLFAPGNDAFAALGDERTNGLRGEAMRPQAIALLRAHIVPGVVTRRDLEAALERNGARPTQMRTMAGGTLTFSRDGDAIVAAGADGARGRLVEETLASNGAIQRTDALLVPVDGAGR